MSTSVVCSVDVLVMVSAAVVVMVLMAALLVMHMTLMVLLAMVIVLVDWNQRLPILMVQLVDLAVGLHWLLLLP